MAQFNQKDFIQFLEKPQKDRDDHWENDFLKNFPQCNVSIVSQVPQVGPDQFPYMFIEVKEDSTESALNLLRWIANNGVGLAVNPSKNYPDFVFTYGMIWNYFRSGQFLENPVKSAHVHGPNCNHDHDHSHAHGHHHNDDPHPDSLKEGTTVYVGSPSEGYLPKEIRGVLKEFLKQQGIMAPKVTMLSTDKVNFDLCFSAESFGTPENNEHEGILQALSWFLPAHYSLAMVSEKNLPSFEDL